MRTFNDFMNAKLKVRLEDDSLRKLKIQEDLIDFSSNDYLGIARNNCSGSTGSRLISGNTKSLENLEESFSKDVGYEQALFFNSGYQANVGLIPALTDRNSTILYDQYIHASLRDGIELSLAKSYSFKHNDLEHLKKHLEKVNGLVLIVVESVYSMDGDSPDLQKLIDLAEEYEAEIVVDEAHALGLIGEKGQGLIAHLKLQKKILATIYPLGKAVGSSGAFVCGSELLKSYLVNFCRSMIFSTAPSQTIVKEIGRQLELMKSNSDRSDLFQLKTHFLSGISDMFEVVTGPFGAIVSVMISGNSNAKKLEKEISEKGVFVKAILHPTIPKGQERLRICFHQYNSIEDVDLLLSIINRSN